MLCFGTRCRRWRRCQWRDGEGEREQLLKGVQVPHAACAMGDVEQGKGQWKLVAKADGEERPVIQKGAEVGGEALKLAHGPAPLTVRAWGREG